MRFFVKRMSKTFHVLWPGGNATALVQGRFSRRQRVAFAKKIMQKDGRIEQVGFLQHPRSSRAAIRLQMMGGEFCGNAARCAGYLWGSLSKNRVLSLEVSGFKRLLRVRMRKNSVTIVLPGSFFVRARTDRKYTIIDLEGIRHCIYWSKGNRRIAETLIEKYKGRYPAVGVLFCTKKATNVFMRPFVWVRDTHTMMQETACASGSIAVVIAMHLHGSRLRRFFIQQPTKEVYAIRFKFLKKKISRITLEGTMKYLGEGLLDA